jgi:hypothetical protein
MKTPAMKETAGWISTMVGKEDGLAEAVAMIEA